MVGPVPGLSLDDGDDSAQPGPPVKSSRAF